MSPDQDGYAASTYAARHTLGADWNHGSTGSTARQHSIGTFLNYKQKRVVYERHARSLCSGPLIEGERRQREKIRCSSSDWFLRKRWCPLAYREQRLRTHIVALWTVQSKYIVRRPRGDSACNANRVVSRCSRGHCFSHRKRALCMARKDRTNAIG